MTEQLRESITNAIIDNMPTLNGLNAAVAAIMGEIEQHAPLRSEVQFQLQARPAEGGDWIDIFPSQLGWMAREGFEVRASGGAAKEAKHCGNRPSVNAYASEYEYRGDQDYVPSEGERAMIEDAIEGYLSLCGDAR